MELREDTVLIRVSEETKITIDRQAINQVKPNETIETNETLEITEEK